MTVLKSPTFPFAVINGSIPLVGEAEALHGQILNVLFTAPGERIDLPEFGCGLFNLVFEPNDQLLGTAVEFTVAQSLTRWLGDTIAVEGIEVTRDGPSVRVEIAYVRRSDLFRDGLRINFREGSAWTTG